MPVERRHMPPTEFKLMHFSEYWAPRQRRHAYLRLNEWLKGAGSTIRRDAPDRRGPLGMELDRQPVG
jgi:hypothetical protein